MQGKDASSKPLCRAPSRPDLFKILSPASCLNLSISLAIFLPVCQYAYGVNVRALFLNLPPAPQLATVSSVYWLRSSTLNRKSQQFCTTSTRPRLDHIDIFVFHGAGERQRRGLAPLPQPQSLGQHFRV